MHALTVRWSLTEAPDGLEEKLAAYVAETSHARFSGMEGLRFETWCCRPGEWFEGCYVFATDEARTEFQRGFTETAADTPVSKLVGSDPILIEASGLVHTAPSGTGTPY